MLERCTDRTVIKYTTSDALGSPRVITDFKGQVVSQRDFQPFGEDILPPTGGRTQAMGYGVSDQVRQKFTGHERDEETGLDFAQARFHSSSFGRFMSVDPLLTSGSIYEPQSWNRYAYGLNNPYVYVDRTGKNPVLAALASPAVVGASVGAAVGAAVSFSFELYKQSLTGKYDESKLYRKTVLGALNGGIGGAGAGFSPATGILFNGFANSITGALGRFAEGQDQTFSAIGQDFLIGAGSGIIASGLNKLVFKAVFGALSRNLAVAAFYLESTALTIERNALDLSGDLSMQELSRAVTLRSMASDRQTIATALRSPVVIDGYFAGATGTFINESYNLETTFQYEVGVDKKTGKTVYVKPLIAP